MLSYLHQWQVFLAAGIQSIDLVFSRKLQKSETVFLWDKEILIRINTSKHLFYLRCIFARKWYFFGSFLFEIRRQHGLEHWRTEDQNSPMDMKFPVCDFQNKVTWFPRHRKLSDFIARGEFTRDITTFGLLTVLSHGFRIWPLLKMATSKGCEVETRNPERKERQE